LSGLRRNQIGARERIVRIEDMTQDIVGRTSRARVRRFALGAALSACVVSQIAVAAPPSYTGGTAAVAQFGEQINLRSQGLLAGTAPMVITTATTNNSLVIATPTVGLCVQINNGQGVDYASNGVLLQVTVANVDAPSGVLLTIPLAQGAGNNNLAACADPNSPPIANAGLDRTLPDANFTSGETVVLDASGSTDSDGTIILYEWTNVTTDQLIGTSTTPTLTTTLPDGVNVIGLTVTDNSGDSQTQSAFDQVTITVQAPATPTANAGPDRTIVDTDRVAGEVVTLNGSASTGGSGPIVGYQWFEGQQSLGAGPTLTVRLADGVHLITLLVTDANQLTSSDTVSISVAVPPPRGSLAALTGLKPSQRAVAVALDDICLRLAQAQSASDLLDRCNGLIFDTDPANQRVALDQLSAEDLSALNTQTLFFANSQTAGVMERLMALRGGAKGLSLSGLTLTIDGTPVPATQLAALGKMVGEVLGGGASADEMEAGSLLSERLGMWLRGTYSDLDKEGSNAGHDFQANQTSLTAGVDFRFTRNFVAGASAGYGDSALDYRGGARGGLDTDGWAAAIYGSAYVIGNFYVDGVVNYGKSDYESKRHIRYLEGTTLIDRTAVGATDGETLSGALSMGYDFQLGALSLSPTAGYLYTEADIDQLAESGAGGLDLIIADRNFSSSTASVGMRAVYALNFQWGVLLPHFRGEFVREFEAEAEVFGVRFANDPFADAANPSPPIVVYTDNPDQSYWKFTIGSSAQFKYGVSAYAEYQRLESFQFVSFDDFTVGLRMQRSF
jgi:outer membrane lipase/esterase